MNITPLATRTTPHFQRKPLNGLGALFGSDDRVYIGHVVYTLFEHGFDIYLGGEILDHAYQGTTAYARIDLVSLTQAPTSRQLWIERLHHSSQSTGSEGWVHFGPTIQRKVGWRTRDVRKGTRFNCIPEMVNPLAQPAFRLDVAVYDGNRSVPTPIYVTFPASLIKYKVVGA